MGFKKTTRSLNFADLALATCLEQNPSITKIEDGIIRKDSTTAELTDFEIQRNKLISKIRYIVEQYFRISHMHDRAKRARFTTLIKNKFDAWFRQADFNIARGRKILSRVEA